jgi:fructoselysine-6-P-deglycase FrlB-like protein
VAVNRLTSFSMTDTNTPNSKSIEVMKREIASELALPAKFELARPIDPTRSVMTGSGDSYVAASIASYLSNCRVICCYPSTLTLNPNILRDRDLYIISVSGRTAHNIAAAKLAKQSNIKTIAITANPQSELAKNCDRIIRIDYTKSGALTSGTVSFLSSVLTCISLTTEVMYNTRDLLSAFKIANIMVDDLLKKIPDALSSVLFLADGLLYPVACYGSLKINEVLGIRSFPYSLEEYCHAPLFSIKKDDSVVIFNSSEGHATNAKTVSKFTEKLEGLNYSFFSLDFPVSSSLAVLFQSIFLVQLLALKMAERNGMTDCFFVQSRDLMEISSGYIY